MRQHFENLRGFAIAYQRALQSHQANVQRFQDAGLVDMNYQQALQYFNLETIEDCMSCIFIHLSELRRIRDSLRDAELEDANQADLMGDIEARIQEFEGIANELLGVSNEYREYLYCLDTFLCAGEYKENSRTPSGNVEEAIVGKVRNILAFSQMDSNFIGNYPTAREFLVDMLHRGIDISRFEENVALDAKLEQASYLIHWLDNQYNQQPEVVI